MEAKETKKRDLPWVKLLANIAKKIFVTDDNPRNEDPQKIRNSIIKRMQKK